ncbi:hypothetical protein D5018_08925 [Parashewanella curva]|uniref:Uncharacterized protein n=1 Tax=Parashewanella curva TaxID=2338552 RepID=A0A3L8PZ21_9GAMM|nr:hypothetical protein D5018_08925 [Parashewanella curva]
MGDPIHRNTQSSLLFVLFAEIVNTAIESVVDILVILEDATFRACSALHYSRRESEELAG